MNHLSANACRVLGTLVEKAQTVASQYPLTLNALVAGVNQKNNRDPVVELDEETVLAGLDELRGLGLVHEVHLVGSRVPKFRHLAREILGIGTSELVLLTELLLRGPQTVGELRGRASRMHPLESVEVVSNLLTTLAEREPPLVEELAPAPGSRAPRYRQLLQPDLHPISSSARDTASSAETPPQREDRLSRLESTLTALEARVAAIERSLGVS